MGDLEIEILRLGHRPVRDKRVTTHLFLAARALGASRAYYTGVRDKEIEEGMSEICRNWGGDFAIEYCKKWQTIVERHRSTGFDIIHLTMYGMPIQHRIERLRENSKDKLILVGGEKVPREVYRRSDWNVAVTLQPHSEVSALAIFLHELSQGRELEKTFDDAVMVIVPQEHGKKVVRLRQPSSRAFLESI